MTALHLFRMSTAMVSTNASVQTLDNALHRQASTTHLPDAHLAQPLTAAVKADVIPLQPRRNDAPHQQTTVADLKADLIQATSTIRKLQGQIFHLKRQLSQANSQAHYAQVYSAQKATSTVTLSRTPSTYIVPNRKRNARFDKLTHSVPFFIL